ncbi:MFS transporter [Streptomyces sp. NPDC088923]|uniref:MFS transporter n=1 Tax=Streptomyces sp. NPDC088923 TaxID=3365913 RepID=UPI00380BBE0F
MNKVLRAGRRATFAVFLLNGFVMGMWVVHIPAVEDRAGIDHALLGWLLLLLGGGAFLGMQAAGPLSDRFGPRRTVPAGLALCAAALVLPGLATNAWTLAGALLVLGFGNGCLDVSMNTHAVQVERGYGRPIMSAFHAVFSVGGVLAALAGSQTLRLDWSPVAVFAVTAVVGIVLAVVVTPMLLRSEAEEAAEAATGPGAVADADAGRDTGAEPLPGQADAPSPPARKAALRTRTSGRIWLLAVLALMLMLSEGVANDWSTLHLKDVLDAPESTAAFAYGAFATAMTVGRFLTDRVAARFGSFAVLRYGAALAAVGMTLAALSPSVWAALVGWTVFGAGLSGCVPQLFSAAGHADPAGAGVNVSRVAGLGYLGMLAGPAVIGPMTHLMPLNLAFFLPVAFCVSAAVAAGVLRTPEQDPAEEPRAALSEGTV